MFRFTSNLLHPKVSSKPAALSRRVFAALAAIAGIGLLSPLTFDFAEAQAEAQKVRFVKAALTCDLGNPAGYFVESRVDDDEAINPPLRIENCGEGHTARLSDRDLRRPNTYLIRSSLKPHGKIRKKTGEVIPGKRVTVAHSSKIRREDAFNDFVRHITKATYRFQVPDTNAATTPVKVTAKRRQRGDISLIQNYVKVSQAFVFKENEETADPNDFLFLEALGDLDGEATLDIPPGEYKIFIREESVYKATGEANKRGIQPSFSRSVVYSVEVPRI